MNKGKKGEMIKQENEKKYKYEKDTDDLNVGMGTQLLKIIVINEVMNLEQ